MWLDYHGIFPPPMNRRTQSVSWKSDFPRKLRTKDYSNEIRLTNWKMVLVFYQQQKMCGTNKCHAYLLIVPTLLLDQIVHRFIFLRKIVSLLHKKNSAATSRLVYSFLTIKKIEFGSIQIKNVRQACGELSSDALHTQLE